MEIPRPSDADKERFRSLVPDLPGVELKPMFGNLGAFVNGNMFAGLFGSTVGVKLSPADLEELRGVEGAGPFGPAGRPMGGYLSIPPSWVVRPELATEWVSRAVDHVSTLPPKVKKPTPRARSAG